MSFKLESINCGISILGILLSYKKEWNTDKNDNVDESQMHYAKWKKPDSNGL